MNDVLKRVLLVRNSFYQTIPQLCKLGLMFISSFIVAYIVKKVSRKSSVK